MAALAGYAALQEPANPSDTGRKTRVAMVRTGEVAIASIGPETMLSASRGGLEVLSVPGTMQALYQFWGVYRPEFKSSPVADPRVREALSWRLTGNRSSTM